MCDCYSYVKIKGDAHIACVVQFYPLSLINLMKNETINCFGFPETHTSVSSLSQSVLYPLTTLLLPLKNNELILKKKNT